MDIFPYNTHNNTEIDNCPKRMTSHDLSNDYR